MRVLLDGYAIKVKAIRGEVNYTCPLDQEKGTEGYNEIIIETDKGEFIIAGCPECGVLVFRSLEGVQSSNEEPTPT